MARVKYQKAAKDYPEAGIKKGEMYYYTRIKTGPYSSRQIRQKTPIRPSQMTSSDFLSQFYGLQEQLQDYSDGIAGLADFLNDIASQARELGQEQQEKFDNMPDNLQQGETGQLLEERANAMDEWADSLEQAATTAEEKAREFEENEEAWKAYRQAIEQPTDDGEPAEVDEPDEPEMDEQEIVQEVIDEVDEPSL